MIRWRGIVAFGVAALAHAAATAAEEGRVVVGQTVALSGPIAEHGKAAAAGARVLFESVNAAGGVHGRRIVVVAEAIAALLVPGVGIDLVEGNAGLEHVDERKAGMAHGGDDFTGRQFFQHGFDNQPTELAGCSCNDDHD